MNNYNDFEKSKELRDHLRICINENLNRFSETQRFNNEFAIKLKSWDLTLFIASVAFCFTEKDKLGDVFYFLPLVPIFLFWFLYAYKIYEIERYNKHNKHKNLIEALSNLYEYSYEDLKNISKNVLFVELDWEGKGKFIPKRFILEKLPGILRGAFNNASNIIFFGMLILVWILFLILK